MARIIMFLETNANFSMFSGPKSDNMISMRILMLQSILLWSITAELLCQRPVYRVHKTSSPIKVDGRLEDLAWQRFPEVGPFLKNTSGEELPLETQAWLAYDDQFLYFAFKVTDENVWATLNQRDDHLWTEEVVEVFLQADPSHPSYIELEVNPLETMLDIFLIGTRKPIPYRSWNSHGLKWGVQVDGTVDGQGGDQGWTCEIALPLAEVITAPNLPPEPGDRWRMNLYRVEAKPEKQGLAWSPTLRSDFHVPEMFGEIVFTGEAVP